MANPYIWAGLERATNDPTTIDAAIAEAITAHDDDPEAHLGPDQSLQSHRASEIIDHLAESVVNDKIKRTARRYVAIVDPASDTDFDTLASAVEYARGVGGGDIYITRGTHFVAANLDIPPTLGFYGDGIGETTIKSNSTTGRSLSFYTDCFAVTGYVLLDDSANGQNTFVYSATYNPDSELVPGMFIRVYGTSEQIIRITAYNSTTRVATLASNITVVDGEAECEFLPGFQLTNGSAQAQMYSNNFDALSSYYAGMSVYNPASGGIVRTLSYDEDFVFQLAEPWTGTTAINAGWLKFLENNTINVQGISFDIYTNPVQFGGNPGNATAYIENCQNVVLNASSGLGVPAMYLGCVFDCKPTGSGGYKYQVQKGITYLNCTFRALANASYGLLLVGAGKVIGCQFLANGFTNHLWLNGRTDDYIIMGSSFESQEGTTIMNGTGSVATASPKIIGNNFTFENNKTVIFQLKRTQFIANKFLFSGTGGFEFNAGGQDNIFSQNYVTGTIADAGTGNIIKDNWVTTGGQMVIAANSDTAMALRWREAVRLTPTSTRTLTTTIAPAGQTRRLIILTSGTTSYTLTFGTGFKSTGTLATGATSARYFVIEFLSNGTSMIETSRTIAMA